VQTGWTHYCTSCLLDVVAVFGSVPTFPIDNPDGTITPKLQATICFFMWLWNLCSSALKRWQLMASCVLHACDKLKLRLPLCWEVMALFFSGHDFVADTFDASSKLVCNNTRDITWRNTETWAIFALISGSAKLSFSSWWTDTGRTGSKGIMRLPCGRHNKELVLPRSERINRRECYCDCV